MSRFARRTVLLSAVCVLVHAVQCGGEVDPSVDAIYGGSASDEALGRVLDKLGTAVTSETAARITMPMDAAVVSASSPPTVAWTLPSASIEGAFAPSGVASRCGPSFGLRNAWAHLPPVTGNVFLLELTASNGEADPVRVFTTEMSWTVDETVWSKIKAPGNRVTIKIYNAYLNRNVVEEGPFTPPAITTFTIGP